MRVRPFFRWYDLWIGAYWDRANRTLYVCPVPCVGLKFEFGPHACPHCYLRIGHQFGCYEDRVGVRIEARDGSTVKNVRVG